MIRRIALMGSTGLALSLAAAGTAAADPAVFTQSTRTAGNGTLTLTAGVSGTAPEQLFISVVFYRGGAGRCADTPRHQAGTHLIDQVPVGPGAYAIPPRSAPGLPPGLWTVCGYAFKGTPPDNLFFVDGNGDIVGTDPNGSGSSGGRAPTAVALAAARQGAKYVYGGRTAGAPTGTVHVQRRSGARWTTFATAAVRRSAWRVVAPGRRGQVVRALLTARGKRPSTSPVKTLR